MTTPHIDLVRAEVQELVDAVVDPNAEEPFGVYVFASSEPGAELGRAVEREVFGTVFGNSPELLTAEYEPYEPASVFFCVIDHRRRVPAGVIRVILPSGPSLKSLDDLEAVWEARLADVLPASGVHRGTDEAWDIATLAVSEDYRGERTRGLVSLALYQAVTHAAYRFGVPWWVAVLDVVVLDLIQTQLQRPFSYFRGVEPKRYLDSPSSIPVWTDLGEWARRMADADPALHEFLVDGTGLEGAVSRPNFDRLPSIIGTRAGDSVRV